MNDLNIIAVSRAVMVLDGSSGSGKSVRPLSGSEEAVPGDDVQTIGSVSSVPFAVDTAEAEVGGSWISLSAELLFGSNFCLGASAADFHGRTTSCVGGVGADLRFDAWLTGAVRRRGGSGVGV